MADNKEIVSTGHKDITIKDGEKKLKVRVFKMDCISAQNWIIKFGAVLARGGFVLPKDAMKSMLNVTNIVSDAIRSGHVFQMPNIDANDVIKLLGELRGFAEIIISETGGNADTIPAADDDLVKLHVSSYSTLLKIEKEVFSYSFGFFES